jgi:hypothetical protein
MRQLFSYLRGQWKAVWVSTRQDDFVIESNTFAPSTELNVEINNYASIIWTAADGAATRQDIEIRYVDGTSDFRQIVNAVLVDGVREVLTLNTGISQDADQIERVSFLIRRRLTNDRVTFRHRWYENEVETAPFSMIDTIEDDI